ncbi:MAG: T9SS type A sorting domain-containing protein [Flavobacteriia bacterium]|jgi:hypothetical protein
MKNSINFAFVFLTFCVFLNGYTQVPANFINPTSDDYINTNINEYNMMKIKEMGFTENIGQLKDSEGQDLSDVFYYSTELSRKILITNHGITLFLFKNGNSPKHEEEFNLEKNKVHSDANWNRIDITVENGNILSSNIEFYEPLPHLTNYFISGTHTNIKSYSKLVIKNVLPGIDWVIYNNSQKGFKYDFIVHPGANPSDLKLNYKSQKAGEINTDGSFSILSESGGIIEAKPYSYLKNDNLTIINTSFSLDQISEITNDNGLFFNTKVTFELANYDQTETLVIDPSVSWSTDIPSNDEEYAYGMTTDESNNVYIVGTTYSTDLPMLDFGAGAYYDGTLTVRSDAFIMKFNNSGVKQWATYYGGNWDDAFTDITCNNSGRLAVVGHTSSSDPTCVAWGSAYYDNTVGASAGSTNAGLILMFNYSGQLFWATTFGAGTTVMLNTAKFDSNNKLYVVGHSGHGGYPVVNLTGAYNTAAPPSGTAGGTSSDIFIARFSTTGVQDWGTWYGGSNAGAERPHTLEIDGSNNMYIGGFTESTNMPCTTLTGAFPNDNSQAGSADGFILKFNSSCVLVWATYIGGTGRDEINTIKINGTQKYVAGIYASSNFSTYTPFPSQPAGAFVNTTLNGVKDAFLIKLNASDDIEWSTLIGGDLKEEIELKYFQGSNVAINSCGNVFFAFPTTSTASLPMLVCDGGYSSTSYTAGFPNYFICSFNSSGKQLWGTYYGAGSYANENPVTLAISPNNDLYFLAERTQFPDINLTKFTKRALTLAQGGASSCSCTATVNPAATCTGTFSYAWTGAGSGTGNIRSSLCNGNYSVTVTDNIMCQTTPINFSINNCAIIILPVEVTNYNAELSKKNTVDLTWQTASERNNDYFTIEKSIDGENWELLGKQTGFGTSNSIHNYYMEDTKPQIGNNYYKLKQTDFDGSQKEIDIKAVRYSPSGLYYLSPNPAKNSVTIVGENLSDYSIKLYNSLGAQILINSELRDQSKIELNSSQLNAGVYFIILDNGDSVENLKLIIQK